ncbi:ATP-binding response regulator [Hymenobacter persicinus]|uniref:histidine kinase n=1 Tax=Hymenobacter persicinus TaxID=2025506 RepID=A0A4Q5LA80_9BACT|nr:hybrid sensor histidine kinase/response regulator [Hymenobacter persicinus]RYU78794.1 hybrid sensor histidine kinase/response regulator [Hymenobacter persicinus]
MKKILLVDDNEQDRMLYKRFLGKQIGHERLEIYEADSGQDALTTFQAQQPDCVLLDYNLLDTDGLEVLESLKQVAAPDSLCVVMITGGGNEALAVRALNSGALDYLVKQHFDQELLCKTVLHAIEKNEWRQYMARYHAEIKTVNQQLRDSVDELTEVRQQIRHKNTLLTMANEEIRARNEQLDTSNQRLARTNADLDNFVYAASHDLRQPVDNLRGLFEELRHSAVTSDPEAEQMWQLVDTSLRALSTTIADLSMVIQMERVPGEQVTELVSLDELTADVLQTLHPQVIASEATIGTDFSALPAVHYVRSNLRTILLNLLTNALKYRHHERPAQVQVRTRREGNHAILEVQDNGLGLNMERYGKDLFQLFRRFHPQAGEGTGVGLFLVNRLVQANGGSIEVDSQEGVGTTFRVQLGSAAG